MSLIVIRYAEIALKGDNRNWFEKMLANNIRQHLKPVTKCQVNRVHSRILLEFEGDLEPVERVLKNIPGIANFSHAHFCDYSLENMAKIGVDLLKGYLTKLPLGNYTFKVDARRSDKQYPLTSSQIGQQLGDLVLAHFPHLKVQLKNPEIALGVEIWAKERSILYLEKIQGVGGLPIQSSGNVISFLSGGIDSPVASWCMMKRGCKTIFLNFHSYPFIGEQSRQKVIDLVTHLSRYQPHSTLIIAPFTKIQKAIKENCEEKFRTIMYRRMMYKIAERIKDRYKATAYVTGEAVGQVASQTLRNLACTEDAATIPVLRPLIGMEKSEIVALAKKMGTFAISVQPFPDCCTVFQPRKPETQGRVYQVVREEKRFDYSALVDEAIENLEILEIATQVSDRFWES